MVTLLGSPLIELAFAYLAWGALSGAYLTVYDRKLPHTDDEWAAFFQRSPKVAALNAIVKTLGWNMPGGLRALRVFFGGPLPMPVRVAIERGGSAGAVAAGKELGREAVEAVTKVAGPTMLMALAISLTSCDVGPGDVVVQSDGPSYDVAHAHGLMVTREDLASYELLDVTAASTQAGKDAAHLRYTRAWQLYGAASEAWLAEFVYLHDTPRPDPVAVKRFEADFSGSWQALQAEIEATQPQSR